MLNVQLIGYACGAGAPDPRCSMGSEMIKQSGLAEQLVSLQIQVQWAPIYHSPSLSSSLPATDIIHNYGTHLKNQVKQAISDRAIPFTIGGDHTMAMGSWSAIAEAHQARGSLGLLWMDAHMDAHSVHTSHSGAYHGMPLGYLLGYGDGPLSTLVGNTSIVNPAHVVLLGVRSFEPEEHALLIARGVRIFFMEDIRRQGLASVMKEALSIVSRAKGGFGISIDLDVFDPSIAPGTGSLADEGLLKDETLPCLQGIARHPLCRGLEIAEFNPALDKNHLTLHLIEAIAQTVFTAIKSGND